MSFQNYEYACGLAREEIRKISDIEQQCFKSGARYQVIDSRKEIVIDYLDQSYVITLPDIEVSLRNSAGEILVRDRILILHYFISAKGTPATDKLITFRELPEGKVYFPTFSKRTIQPLMEHFGKEPHLLVKAAGKLGGVRVDYGDLAVTINAFTRVPITIIMWRGDEEFAPQGNVVFDANIIDYLPTEDITVLCETIAWRLVRYLRESH